jgi:hypothetical protein
VVPQKEKFGKMALAVEVSYPKKNEKVDEKVELEVEEFVPRRVE